LDLNNSFSVPKADDTPAPAVASAVPDFDLSGITLDLTPAVEMATAPEQSQGAAVVDANLAEMATKLDLAIAYQEIGDKEGARELLNEVVKGGSAEQTEKARTILQKFA
jgi:pilus assembly protein FimV